jgi:hypothetical protein
MTSLAPSAPEFNTNYHATLGTGVHTIATITLTVFWGTAIPLVTLWVGVEKGMRSDASFSPD